MSSHSGKGREFSLVFSLLYSMGCSVQSQFLLCNETKFTAAFATYQHYTHGVCLANTQHAQGKSDDKSCNTCLQIESLILL